MLPKYARLTSSEDFARATRSGFRITTTHFVGYLYLKTDDSQAHPKCGLIIGKSVGGSVVRHTLARKIRHALQPLITELPNNSLLVIRALNRQDRNTVHGEIADLTHKLIEKSEKATAM